MILLLENNFVCFLFAAWEYEQRGVWKNSFLMSVMAISAFGTGQEASVFFLCSSVIEIFTAIIYDFINMTMKGLK